MPLCGRIALLALLALLAQAKPRPAKAWKDVNWDLVDKQFQDGDDPELLRTEDEVSIKLMERRKNKPLEAPPGVDTSMGEVFQHAQATAGPAMLFVGLRPTQANGSPWDKAAYNALATEWREVLFTAGIELSAYDVAERSILVTLQSGWRGWDVKEYLLREHSSIIEDVEWDKVKYTPSPAPSAKVSKRRGRGGARGGAASAASKPKATAVAGTRGDGGDTDVASGSRGGEQSEL